MEDESLEPGRIVKSVVKKYKDGTKAASEYAARNPQSVASNFPSETHIEIPDATSGELDDVGVSEIENSEHENI
jgi:hypothetical protein